MAVRKFETASMRIALGLLSLVLVLAIVGVAAKRSLHATTTVPASALGASASDAGATRTPQQVTRKVADDLDAAMRQGASRAEGADR